MATIGMWVPVVFSFSRIIAVASRPPISGICTSIRMRSNPRCSKAASASRPLRATTTVCPCFLRMRTANSWFTELSSANRIRPPRRPLRDERRPGREVTSLLEAVPSTEKMASNRSDCLTGLVRYAASPNWRARRAYSGWLTEVNMMIVLLANFSISPDAVSQSKSVHLRHLAINERQGEWFSIRARSGHHRQRFLGRGNCGWPHLPAKQHLFQDEAVRRVVVHNEHGKVP